MTRIYRYRITTAADKAAGRNCGNCKHRAYYAIEGLSIEHEGWYCVLQGFDEKLNGSNSPSAKYDYVCDNFVRK